MCFLAPRWFVGFSKAFEKTLSDVSKTMEVSALAACKIAGQLGMMADPERGVFVAMEGVVTSSCSAE